MPINFELRFALLGAVEQHPWGNPFLVPAVGGPKSIEDLFYEASEEDIALTPTFLSEQPLETAGLSQVWPIDLHNRLHKIVNNSAGIGPIANLGVIFAPVYAPRRNVFGVMFDTGFLDADQAEISNDDISVPREGCAIFINRIREARTGGVSHAPYNTAADSQIAYTVAHELGHMFNLKHTNNLADFLEPSPAGNNPPPLTWYRFLDYQRDWLRLCSESGLVQPGGEGFDAIYYADERRRRNLKGAQATGLLKLSVRIQPRSFFAWEPVEMDVLLKHTGEAGGPDIEIPDEIDPGYSTFTIWVEQPDGERRRYKATKHYCPSSQKFSLRVGSTFRRDISIFGQSGGYTFRIPGQYYISIEWHIGHQRTLISNRCSVEVRGEQFRDKGARSRHESLRKLTKLAAKALYYRTGFIDGVKSKALKVLATRPGSDHVKSSAEYAIGRLLQHQVLRDPSNTRKWLKIAKPYLERASQREALSLHRRAKARELA